jgi:hypothetical protein
MGQDSMHGFGRMPRYPRTPQMDTAVIITDTAAIIGKMLLFIKERG